MKPQPSDAVNQVVFALLGVATFRRRRIVRAFLPPGELTRLGIEAAEMRAINSGCSDAVWPWEHTRWSVTLETTGECPQAIGILIGEWGEAAASVEWRLAEAVVASPEWQERNQDEGAA